MYKATMKKVSIGICLIVICTLIGCGRKTMSVVIEKPTETQVKVATNKVKVGEKKTILYKNEKLGFQLNLPLSWEGHYDVQENEDGINLVFKSNIKPAKGGLLLSISKYKEGGSDFLDNVKIVNLNNEKYVLGQSTDVNLDYKHPEFNLYSKMEKEALLIENTIKAIK